MPTKALISRDAKSTNWSFRISERQLNTIKARAHKAGLTTSDYVIRCALGELDPDEKEMDLQLAEIRERLDTLERLAGLGAVD